MWSCREKLINRYTKFTIIKFTSIIPTMNIQQKWTTLQNSLGYIFYQWMALFKFFKKIRSGRLHGATLINLIFFCLFPTKHFHRGKTMMSSSSSLCWDCVVARFFADLWIRKISVILLIKVGYLAITVWEFMREIAVPHDLLVHHS